MIHISKIRKGRAGALHNAAARLNVASIYIVGPPNGRPVKIGVANDIRKRLTDFNIAHWDPIVSHYICPIGRLGPYCFTIEKAIHAELKKQGKHLRGEWFDLEASEALKVVERFRAEMVPDEEKAKIRQLEALLRGQNP